MFNRRTVSTLMLATAAALAAIAAWAATAPASTPAAKPDAATQSAPTAGAHPYAPVNGTPAATAPKVSASTADHSKFKELQRPFATGPDVTKACLACHTEAAKQVHQSKHWTWEFLNPDTQQRLGKKNIINNFCTAVPSNYTVLHRLPRRLRLEGQQFRFQVRRPMSTAWCATTPPAPTANCRGWPDILLIRTWNSRRTPARSSRQ